MEFTKEQENEHRATFIKECRQKAWGTACHADWVQKGMDRYVAEFKSIQAEDADLGEQIEELKTASDHHTVDNRNKRNALEGRRDSLTAQMKILGQNIEKSRQGLEGLYQSCEASLQIAEHAKDWTFDEELETKEV